MKARHPSYTNEQWEEMIRDCRGSDLTLEEWCWQHQISRSNFYYHERKQGKHSGSLPAPAGQAKEAGVIQAVVPLTVEEEACQPPSIGTCFTPDFNPAIRIICRTMAIEITNGATGDLIANTLAALEASC